MILVNHLQPISRSCRVLKSLPFIALVVFAVTPTALAQEAPANPASPSLGEALIQMLPMFAMIFLIFYFMVIKPQQSKLKAQQAMHEGLKRGDKVVTSGGLVGKFTAHEDEVIVLEIANNVKARVTKSSIVRKLEGKQDKKKAA